MRCPDCRKPIRWLPLENGVRVPMGVETVPSGEYYLDEQGVVRAVTGRTLPSVPRYAMHVFCEEGK